MSATKRNIKHAIEAVEEKGVHTDLELFHAIERSPNQSIYSMAKQMNWSTGKTYASARRLEKVGMIHVQKAVQNDRKVLILNLPAWHESLREYFTPEELEEMHKPEFMDEVEDIIKKDV